MAYGIRIGYGRISTKEQPLEVQRQQLEAAGCHKIRLEMGSGTTLKRPHLQEILRWIGEGDVLVVCKLDRLARSISDLYWIVGQLRERGATLEVLDQPLDLETMGGKITFTILGLCAELETSLRKERQMAGIRAAQAKGVHFGRQKALNPAQVAMLCQRRTHGATIRELMQEFQLGKSAICRYLAAAPQGQAEGEAAD